MSEVASDIYQAFFEAQKSMSNAIKGSNNPFFKSKYADLNSVREAVMPALIAQEICVVQPEVVIDGRNYVRTELVHVPSKTSIHSDVEILYKTPNDPQAQGSAITYARRYGLQSICAIGADDDDGNKASGKEPAKDTKQKPDFKPAKLEDTEGMQRLFDWLDKAKTSPEERLKASYLISDYTLEKVIEQYNAYKHGKSTNHNGQ